MTREVRSSFIFDLELLLSDGGESYWCRAAQLINWQVVSTIAGYRSICYVSCGINDAGSFKNYRRIFLRKAAPGSRTREQRIKPLETSYERDPCHLQTKLINSLVSFFFFQGDIFNAKIIDFKVFRRFTVHRSVQFFL